ncbi:response regulator [Arenibaculum sp.]|uniref:response regulator n=1 Tax=Arenibaculum sp. TaxID=2865862 RepID=UPI002E168799|nr:response regulator [Arenibaculum sp.]
MRILLVEDEFLIAMEQRLYLEDAGHVVAGPATDTREALAMAAAGSYDLALVDVHLARGSSGIDVAAGFAPLGIRCLFVTSHPQDVLGAGLGLGVLMKPFTAEDLLSAVAAVAALLEGRPAPADLPRTLTLFAR